jgi:hypothetical protein
METITSNEPPSAAEDSLFATPTPVSPLWSPTPTPVPQMILIGEVQTLLASGAPQYWGFAGTAGDLLSITLTTDAGRVEGSMILYAPDGSELAFVSSGKAGNDVVISGFALPQTGTYTLVTQPYGTQDDRALTAPARYDRHICAHP